MSRYLRQAAAAAWKSSKKGWGGPFGAVIVKGSRIISEAHNTVLKSKDPTAHAEINAIRSASKKLNTPFLSGCTIYSTTEPCPMCFSAIHWAKLKKIVFATRIADVKKLGFNELSISNNIMKEFGQSPVQITRVKNNACSNLIKKWKNLPKSKTY